MNNNNFLDMVNIISLVLAMENLQENREQSKHNDVQIANNKQADFLLGQINKRFDEQNQILTKQNEILEELLERMRFYGNNN